MPTLQVFVSDETLARLTLCGAEDGRKVETLAAYAIEDAANTVYRGRMIGPIYRRAVELAKAYVKRSASTGAGDSELTERAEELVNSGIYPQFIKTARAEVEAERKRAAESLGIKS